MTSMKRTLCSSNLFNSVGLEPLVKVNDIGSESRNKKSKIFHSDNTSQDFSSHTMLNPLSQELQFSVDTSGGENISKLRTNKFMKLNDVKWMRKASIDMTIDNISPQKKENMEMTRRRRVNPLISRSITGFTQSNRFHRFLETFRRLFSCFLLPPEFRKFHSHF